MTTAARPSCAELFESMCLEGAALQDAVYLHYGNGACELEKVSADSPGPVTDDEVLTRLVVHPIHYDDRTGTISPMAFADVVRLDLSVFREGRAEDKELQLAIDQVRATGETKIPPQDRVVDLILQAPASEIRAIVFEADKTRMFWVYDTATPEKPSHASVFTEARSRTSGGTKRARRALLEVFSKRQLKPDQYRKLAYEGRAVS